MKRATHILLGAAVAMPIAAPLSPALAVGAIWWGMVGGGFPDWFDLRSDFRDRLKHRGVSHSLILGALLAIGLQIALRLLSDQFSQIALSPEDARLWAITFAAGFLSHVLADACTIAGVRPFLPFSSMTVWIIPAWLRGKSTGAPDTVVRFLAILMLLAGSLRYLDPLLNQIR